MKQLFSVELRMLDNNSNVFSFQIKFENAINAVKERDFDAYVAVCKVS